MPGAVLFIARVVVIPHQPASERGPVAALGHGAPGRDPLGRVQGGKAGDGGLDPARLGHRVGIGPGRIGRPRRQRHLEPQPGRGAQRLPHGARHREIADARAFGLDHRRARGVQRRQRHGKAAFEQLLRGLPPGHRAEQAAPVVGQPFQVDHLHAPQGKPRQDLGLGRAGIAVQHDQRRGRPEVLHLPQHQRAPGLPAPFQPRCPPADLRQDRRKGARPLPPAPAVDQRPPAAVMPRQRPRDVARDIGRRDGAADLAGLEGRDLLVDRADLGPLGVVQDGQVDRAGQVILGVFGWRTRVDDRVEPGFRQVRQAGHAELGRLQAQ